MLDACNFFQKRLYGDLHEDFNTGVFLWNLQNLQETFLYKTILVTASLYQSDYNVLYSVFCNFRNWMYKGPALNFWNWFWVRCLYATKTFNFQVSNWWLQLYVAYFLNPLIEDYLGFFDTPAPVHGNYTLSLTRERKGKRKRWKKNSI